MCTIIVKGHHIEVTESIQTAVDIKFNKLKDLSANVGTSASLGFKQEGGSFEVNLVYRIKQIDIVVKKQHADLYAAINQAFDVAMRKVKSQKPNRRAALSPISDEPAESL